MAQCPGRRQLARRRAARRRGEVSFRAGWAARKRWHGLAVFQLPTPAGVAAVEGAAENGCLQIEERRATGLTGYRPGESQVLHPATGKPLERKETA